MCSNNEYCMLTYKNNLFPYEPLRYCHCNPLQSTYIQILWDYLFFIRAVGPHSIHADLDPDPQPCFLWTFERITVIVLVNIFIGIIRCKFKKMLTFRAFDWIWEGKQSSWGILCGDLCSLCGQLHGYGQHSAKGQAETQKLQHFTCTHKILIIRGRFPWDFPHSFTMILHSAQEHCGRVDRFEPGTSAPEVWSATTLSAINNKYDFS